MSSMMSMNATTPAPSEPRLALQPAQSHSPVDRIASRGPEKPLERAGSATPSTLRSEMYRHKSYEPIKTVLDLTFGTLLLLLFSPVILMVAMSVRLTSRGPAFYTQTRVGKHGRPFRIYKIRTMVHNCEQRSGVRWAVPGDSRITPLGRFLRRTHLDELPQLLNVLRLEMSLVGPRPERPEIIQVLEAEIQDYRDRLCVRPGVTGLAQLRLPADTDIPGVRKKLTYDLHYIRSMGFWLDIRLVTCTALKVVGVSLNRMLWLCRVPGCAVVEAGNENARSEP